MVPVGCSVCGNTGYAGRTGIYELMTVDEHMRTLIHDQASEQDLREAARVAGMHSLREDGERWVVSGDTALEEVVRVTRD
jgi:general secretion pathway protein E